MQVASIGQDVAILGIVVLMSQIGAVTGALVDGTIRGSNYSTQELQMGTRTYVEAEMTLPSHEIQEQIPLRRSGSGIGHFEQCGESISMLLRLYSRCFRYPRVTTSWLQLQDHLMILIAGPAGNAARESHVTVSSLQLTTLALAYAFVVGSSSPNHEVASIHFLFFQVRM